MKSKILIFILTIFTFGLFLIPYSFAQDYGTNDLNKVNLVNRVDVGENDVRVYFDYSVLNTMQGNIYCTLSVFDSSNNYNLYNITSFVGYCAFDIATSQNHNVYYIPSNTGDNTYYFYSGGSANGTITNAYFFCAFSNTNVKQLIIDNVLQFQVLAYKTTNSNAVVPYVPYFIGNTFYSSYKNVGVFNNTQVNLLLQGQQGSGRDVTSEVLSFNTISFSEPLLTQIANNNNVSGYQYYIRVYFRDYLKNLTNFNLSYLEIYDIRFNGVTYNSVTSARQQLPILSNNITLYNNDATLFTTDNIINSGYENYYLEYITFNIVNYDFKSSSYYNANIGIKGYLESTYISAIGVNAIESYNEGLYEGYQQGEKSGYDKGYRDGVASNRTGFDNLMFAIADVPIGIISSMLNFEILGVNLLGFFMGIITLTLFIFLFRKFKE